MPYSIVLFTATRFGYGGMNTKVAYDFTVDTTSLPTGRYKVSGIVYAGTTSPHGFPSDAAGFELK